MLYELPPKYNYIKTVTLSPHPPPAYNLVLTTPQSPSCGTCVRLLDFSSQSLAGIIKNMRANHASSSFEKIENLARQFTGLARSPAKPEWNEFKKVFFNFTYLWSNYIKDITSSLVHTNNGPDKNLQFIGDRFNKDFQQLPADLRRGFQEFCKIYKKPLMDIMTYLTSPDNQTFIIDLNASLDNRRIGQFDIDNLHHHRQTEFHTIAAGDFLSQMQAFSMVTDHLHQFSDQVIRVDQKATFDVPVDFLTTLQVKWAREYSNGSMHGSTVSEQTKARLYYSTNRRPCCKSTNKKATIGLTFASLTLAALSAVFVCLTKNNLLKPVFDALEEKTSTGVAYAALISSAAIISSAIVPALYFLTQCCRYRCQRPKQPAYHRHQSTQSSQVGLAISDRDSVGSLTNYHTFSQQPHSDTTIAFKK